MGATVKGISRNLESVRARIAAACARAGRESGAVRLVAVTKAVGVAEARALISLGVGDLGENRVAEALDKIDGIGEAPVRWHMIGHLQRRKARLAVGRFAMIHSVDSVRLLEELEKRAAAAGSTEEILAELNVSGEESKYGLRPSGAEEFCRAAAGCSCVRLRGFMTMAPLVDDPEEVRPVFAALRELLERTNAGGVCSEPLTELSMGMTNDYEVAVEEGATIVRVGTALFE